MADAGLVSGVSHSLRMSTWRSLTLLTHCLTDSSLHTSSGSSVSVSPYASPAASRSLSFFFSVTAIRNPMPEEQPVISTTFCPLVAMLCPGRRRVEPRSSALDGRCRGSYRSPDRTELMRIMQPPPPREPLVQSHVQ
ncbi:hypothetical protein EYF80_050024 [Liparis tanakae]|uniref:Uncharacterized protein n=1 Tax=Liparis tanakae TaxID=230148 RepID=A0A4Z2FF63_9TELE|nr:hypothetical protein EYF80_050024 [Liparis tanakae]